MSETCQCPPEAGSATCELHVSRPHVACPTNQQVGKAVDSVTLKALLAVSLTEVRPVEYRFCPAPDCPTVYYSTDGAQCFTESDLRERVYQKHPHAADVFVCYCFRHTVGGLKVENGDAVLTAINTGIRAGQCACDLRNPQGSCCLGNARAVVQRLAAQH